MEVQGQHGGRQAAEGITHMTSPWDSLRNMFRGRGHAARRAPVRLLLEPLEDRLALSATSPVDAYSDWRQQSFSLDAVASATPAASDVDASMSRAGSLIGLDDVFADYTYRGTGYSVAVIDTGIDYTHPALGGVWGKRVVAGWDFVNNDADPRDDNGHGTHVAGIIGSSDATYTGVAPDVNLIALKVLDRNGSGTFGAVEDALKWVIANQAKYNIVAINLSLGAGNFTVNPYAFMEDEFATLNGQGVFIAAASGNSFISYNSQPGLGYPAISDLTVAVGAVWSSDFGTVNWFNGASDFTTAADRITSFTQRSAQLDILAPGAMITSTYLNGAFTGLSGTSMAAPVIAGAAVLLHQALDATGHAAQANQDGILALMKSTGVSLNDGDDENDNVINTGLNFRRLNLHAALGAISVTNRAPELGSIANQHMSSGQDTLTLNLQASDPDGDALTYSARTIGSTPAVQYRFTGTQLTIDPPAGFLGTFQVEITVSDGTLTASRTFLVTVDTASNTAPTLDPIANQTVSTGVQSRSITLVASDLDNDPLTFSARTVSASNPLAALDQQLGLNFGGSYNTNVLQLNEKWIAGTGSWYILLPNGELRRWLGTTPATLGSAALVQTLPTAVHGDPSLLWNASTTPAVTYSFSGTQFTIQLHGGFLGSFVVEVAASDGEFTASRSFTINVGAGTANAAPVFHAIPDQKMTFGQGTLSFALPISDPDGDAISFSTKVTPGSNALYDLKQKLGLRSDGNYHANALRLNEKWLQSSKAQWYILLPNGELRRWLGTLPQTMSAAALVQTLPTQVHTDPTLLLNAGPSPAVLFSFTGTHMTTQLGGGFLGSFTVEVIATAGSHTVSRSFAVTVSASPATSAGINLTAAEAAYLTKLDKKLGLDYLAGYSPTTLGLGEKWLLGKGNRWYVLLPNGELRQWKGTLDKTLVKKALVGQVSTLVFDNPVLLWNATGKPKLT